MNVLGIVITDGVGYRNFLMSNFFKEVVHKFDKVIIYSGLPKEVYKFDDSISSLQSIEIRELQVFREPHKTWFFRKLKEVAHMTLHKDYYGINDALKLGYPTKNTKKGLVTKLIYTIANLFHSEKNIQWYEYLQFSSFKKHAVTESYLEFLKQDTPNQLFFTHQRPPYLAPLLASAKKLKIKTISFIFSWDNLASKGRMLGTFDGYMVWSELMKKELIYFYPEVKENQIKVIGTPQFEPYVMEEYKVDKLNFYKKFGLNINKKIICYSCADSSIGKNDEVHIRGVLSYIKKQDTNKIQLLVRTSPAEDGKRFRVLKNEFPEVKWNIPKWILTRDNHVESWSQRLPSYEDVIDLKSILSYADVNVNMCSTMSLDFMLFDKPVINTVFGNKSNNLYDDQRFLNYLHYKYVIDSKGVTIAKNEKELHQQLNEALTNPELRKIFRQNLIKLEISKSLKGTSKRIVKALKEFA